MDNVYIYEVFIHFKFMLNIGLYIFLKGRKEGGGGRFETVISIR